MPPKAKIPAPIDRPLSRAYLREFSGWSTAFPPGLSQPTSLRTMENTMVNRDGSLRIRPGLKYLSYSEAPLYEVPVPRVTPVVVGHSGATGSGLPYAPATVALPVGTQVGDLLVVSGICKHTPAITVDDERLTRVLAGDSGYAKVGFWVGYAEDLSAVTFNFDTPTSGNAWTALSVVAFRAAEAGEPLEWSIENVEHTGTAFRTNTTDQMPGLDNPDLSGAIIAYASHGGIGGTYGYQNWGKAPDYTLVAAYDDAYVEVDTALTTANNPVPAQTTVNTNDGQLWHAVTIGITGDTSNVIGEWEARGKASDRPVVGTHEPFFLADGAKAYLYAVRELDGSVGFRVARWVGDNPAYRDASYLIHNLDHPDVGFAIDATHPLNFSPATTYVKYLQIDNKIIALSDAGEPARLFRVGAVKRAKQVAALTVPHWDPGHAPYVQHPEKAWVDAPGSYVVTGAPATIDGLTRAWMTTGEYAVAYWYTFSNEFGESAPSTPTVMYVKRPWSGWAWQTPDEDANPSGTATNDPTKAADQMVVYPLQPVFDQAVAEGALYFNVYMMTWSSQDPVPVEGLLIGRRQMRAEDGTLLTPERRLCYVQHTPATNTVEGSMLIPTVANIRNYSVPPRAAQGIVASDRMVLVNDPTEAAVVRWSSNRMGEYINFTANKGGGYKTLTSGNLHIPACVKLWQNPQSADTITVLCLGVDGHSTAYYMAPAQIASQSDATNIMGFEETTATPGTTSPYGCEVLNNALYHPVESELTKSTASNYNINHKSMTDLITDEWKNLVNKDEIVSSVLDNRLYYLVHNPSGAPREAGCWGNEVWVCDTAAEGGTWSRWLVQGHSLRKIEVGGRVMMSLVRPDGIFAFDDRVAVDEYVNPDLTLAKRPIPWKIETNTQGANRAHDAWAHLQQVSLTLGNFSGALRWGVRGHDLNGKYVETAKVTQDKNPLPADGRPFDVEDHLRVARDMKEWRFFAESREIDGVVQSSAGQLSLVQYRYTPVSVNVGYEYGSVETFEYTRNLGLGNDTLSVNGVPTPMMDTGRP
jgi:hypothetical protein